MTDTNQKKKILILDDDKFLLTMYATKFTATGADVETVESGEELLKKLREGATPDLLLLDIIVPGITGIDALEVIRKENLVPHSKIVMLTNESDKTEIDRAEAMKIDGYIVKAMATPSEVVEQSLKKLQ